MSNKLKIKMIECKKSKQIGTGRYHILTLKKG